MVVGAWWRKNVIEKVHAAAYSGNFTIKNPITLNLVKLFYFSAPVVLGMQLMSMVTEGGAFHQDAAGKTLENKEELIAYHKQRMLEAKAKREEAEAKKKGLLTGVLPSDYRMIASPDNFKKELDGVLQESTHHEEKK
mmetsp:Transcript_33126/g.83593  ORF Transcript_33126/g.83593 Transcript_33126/m.83593 type:complete len:137 (+) Transcript_33126:58-468(+)